MAEVTGLRNNACPFPIYAAPFGVVFPMLDADGDLITGATTPDAEVSKNGDTFADCTNESTEIATASGMYYLLLTATEMTADVVTVIAKSATAGMKTTPIVLYPRKLVTVRSGTSASGGAATGTIVLDASASPIDDFYNGMVVIATIDSNVEARVISDYVGSTQTASVVPDWNVAPDNNDTFVIKLPEGVQVIQANTTHIGGTLQTANDVGADVNDILVDTAEIGAAGAGLTNINLPNQTMDIVGNITGNLSGSVGSVTGAVGSVTGAVGSVTAGVTLANDAITAAKFDETTAFPLKSDDSGATQVARTGADADTLETLSDQLDAKASQASVDTIDNNVDAILVDTGTTLQAEVDGIQARLSTLVTKTATVQTDAGNSATQILTNLTETEVDHWAFALVKITSGALAEQVRKVTGYDGAGTLTFTDGFTDTPADGVTLELVND